MSDAHPTERFSDRVDSYVRFRPNYPEGIISLLREEIALTTSWKLADIGSGPGNLTRLFLDHGFSVTAVEPNDAMRHAGEQLLSGYANFTSVDGAAESTTLAGRSVDLITAGQAFHWFDPAATRVEFLRILRDPGWVSLIWNKRPEGFAPVLDAWHDMLLEHSTEYTRVRHRDEAADEGMTLLFGASKFRRLTLPHMQKLDGEAFWGRLISSSYTPLPGEPGHDEIKARNEKIFEEYAVDGVVAFPYETQIFVGRLR